MKPKKQTCSSDEENSPAKIPARRLWLFRIFAAVFVPLLLVGALELGLRIIGYGYPTSFFLRTKINGDDFYVPNDRFGYRFFPPTVARTPVPLRMAAKKPSNAFRIFLFGESAAQGDPDPTFGSGRYLENLLRERYPGTDFEVVCVAMTAINSHAILPIVRECAKHDGDLWIVYMGNNEMIGPFGASTVFGTRVPAVGLVRVNLAVRATRTGQLLEKVMQHVGSHSSAPKTWEGLNMFKDHPLRYDDPNRLRAYENFKKNLADILSAGRSAGVPVILSTVGSNLKDCAPFGSANAKTLDETHKAAWNRWLQDGVAAEATGNYQEALHQFSGAAGIDAESAELQFRMGSCDLALTNTTQAIHEFELARDYDTLVFRADTRINQIIKDAADAQANHGVHFLDARRVLADHSPGGIPGNELFYEHVHLNFAGNYLLGRAFAEQTAKLLPKTILAHEKNEWATAEVCDRNLAVSLWDRSRVWQANFSRVSEPPFTSQLNDVPRAKFYMAKLNELGSQMNDATLDQSRAMYSEATTQRPDDFCLRQNFAQFLSQIGDLTNAVKEEQRFGELLPQTPLAPFKIGTLLVREGDIVGAEAAFSHALAVHPDYVPALNELALISANREKTAEAAARFFHITQVNPGSAEAFLGWGFMEQIDGKLDQAEAHYHEAANLQPDGPMAYFYQAYVLATQHRRDDSINQFQAAIWMNPQFWQARFLLGIELAGEKRVDEAKAQFAEVVRIRPDFSKAHSNYGVALAKQGDLEAALKEFQITMKLNPVNTNAQRNLEAVQANLEARKARSGK